MLKRTYKYFGLLALALSGTTVFGQEATEKAVYVPEKSWTELPMEQLLLIVILSLILIVVGIILLGITIDWGRNVRKELKSNGKEVHGIINWFGVFDGDLSAATGEYKDEIMDHDYDGIKEFDNDLPPWWKYMFYATIVFGVIYLFHFHILGTGDLQTVEYNKEKAYMEAKYPDVDPVFKEASSEAAVIKSGAKIFAEKCAVCHRADLGGQIGPNLTDKFWINGGGINNIFKTIKHGGRDGKGMQPWKSEFNNDQIFEIASFIMSKANSNPKDPKPNAPEAKEWVPEEGK